MTVAEQVQAGDKFSETLSSYAGRWVAVADFEVLDNAATLGELLEQIEGREQEVEEVFQVAEENLACFY